MNGRLNLPTKCMTRLGMLAVLAVACDEPLAPEDLQGTYVLQRVADDALPAVLYSNDQVIVRVFAETLYFATAERGSRNVVLESELVSGGSPERFSGETAFGFQIIDERIEIAFDCPINANCVPPPHLVLRRTSDGLQADFAFGSRTPLRYSRLSSAR